MAVFPGTMQRSSFSAPDASAFTTRDSRRATTFCGRFGFLGRYSVEASPDGVVPPPTAAQALRGMNTV